MIPVNRNDVEPLDRPTLKPVESLTEAEKFKIALAAGVRIQEWVRTSNGFRAVLRPCSISIFENRYLVVSRE